jgi:hypothetical protein
MKKSTVLTTLAALLAVVLLAGCYPVVPAGIVGSTHLTTRDMDLAGFDTIDASSAFQVEVTQSDAYNVSVTANDNMWNQLDVRVDGNTLRLGLKPSLSLRNVTLRAKVSLPKLAGLNLSGASRATLNGFNSQDAVNMQLSGASRATLQGSATSLRLDASGASNADLSGFSVDKANVQLSGASRANLKINESVDYDISGASHLTYTGDARAGHTQNSGASSVDHE